MLAVFHAGSTLEVRHDQNESNDICLCETLHLSKILDTFCVFCGVLYKKDLFDLGSCIAHMVL